ncbi:MAG: hypothetical protein K2K57_08840 [Oscillospiraceae bacterium]|nr:hypothetical protein [Oscillospiraceae bacterium]
MKVKKKAAAAAAFFSVAMSFSACHNYGSGVYGPPPEDFDDEAVTQSETENISDNTEDENTGDDIR